MYALNKKIIHQKNTVIYTRNIRKNKIINARKNKGQFVYLSLYIFTYFAMAFNHLLIKDFLLSRIFCIFLGTMSLFFLNKTYIIPKKSHFILGAILVIFIFISFLSLFLV